MRVRHRGNPPNDRCSVRGETSRGGTFCAWQSDAPACDAGHARPAASRKRVVPSVGALKPWQYQSIITSFPLAIARGVARSKLHPTIERLPVSIAGFVLPSCCRDWRAQWACAGLGPNRNCARLATFVAE